jgi:hypothetical protein
MYSVALKAAKLRFLTPFDRSWESRADLIRNFQTVSRDCLEIRIIPWLEPCKSVMSDQELLFWTLCTIHDRSREAPLTIFQTVSLRCRLNRRLSVGVDSSLPEAYTDE